MDPILTVENLSVRYRAADDCSLRDVNLTVSAGETIGILGPSGSGKSTLALSILGALPETAHRLGTIRYLGDGMAPIFQEPAGALHPLLSAGRQVYEAVRARRGWDAARCRAEARGAMQASGLKDVSLYDAWPHQLSGGQRQRVLIAQAIAGQPALIVADEPTASLDPEMQAEVLNLLRELQQRLSLTLIFITHSPRLLTDFATRVFTLEEGRLFLAA